MKTQEEIIEALPYFHGSEEVYKFSSISHLSLSEGAKFIAENCKAYWFMDIISSYQNKLINEKFQVWTLTVFNSKCEVVCTNGNETTLVTQKIKFTDFPLDSIKLYCTNNVILLPSEY